MFLQKKSPGGIMLYLDLQFVVTFMFPTLLTPIQGLKTS
jgi:hypothetical protein